MSSLKRPTEDRDEISCSCFLNSGCDFTTYPQSCRYHSQRIVRRRFEDSHDRLLLSNNDSHITRLASQQTAPSQTYQAISTPLRATYTSNTQYSAIGSVPDTSIIASEELDPPYNTAVTSLPIQDYDFNSSWGAFPPMTPFPFASAGPAAQIPWNYVNDLSCFFAQGDLTCPNLGQVISDFWTTQPIHIMSGGVTSAVNGLPLDAFDTTPTAVKYPCTTGDEYGSLEDDTDYGKIQLIEKCHSIPKRSLSSSDTNDTMNISLLDESLSSPVTSITYEVCSEDGTDSVPETVDIKPCTAPSLPKKKHSSQVEHQFVYFESMQLYQPPLKPAKRPGRTGPLQHSKREEANAVRKLGGCLPCRRKKIKCDEGRICAHCQKLPFLRDPHISQGVCFRLQLQDCSVFFDPDPVFKSYKSPDVDNLLRRSIKTWEDTSFILPLTSGASYDPMLVEVCRFIPTISSEIELRHSFTDEKTGQAILGETHYTPPICLDPTSSQNVRDLLEKHIDSIHKRGRCRGEMTFHLIPEFAWRVLDILSASGQHDSSKELMVLFEKIYHLSTLMDRKLRCPTDEVDTFATMLGLNEGTGHCDKACYSLLLITAQIKKEALALIYDYTHRALSMLVGMLDEARKADWVTIFCGITLLCLSVETFQKIFSARLLRDFKRGRLTSPDKGIELCRRLENVVVAQSKDLFLKGYHMKKSKSGSRRLKSFNPLRDGLEVNPEEGISQDMVDLITEFRELIKNKESELAQRAVTPWFPGTVGANESHGRFRERNTCRLAADFLLAVSRA